MTAAERMRAYRERLRLGIQVVPTPVSCEDVQNLIAAGLLAERDETNKQAVADALRRAAQSLPLKKRVA
jgi:hypothetical protein